MEDTKYKFEDGAFINRVSGEAIPDDEPVIIFRARDKHALRVIQVYYDLIPDTEDSRLHRAAVMEKVDDFRAFAMDHPSKMREPGVPFNYKLKDS